MGRRHRPKVTKYCLICNDIASGINFNARTCMSCKAFFRRNGLGKKELKCPFGDACRIDAVTRKFCAKCRLSKCFAVGMRKEWILSDEEKQRYKNKVQINRIRRQSINISNQQQQQSQTPSSHRSQSTNDEENNDKQEKEKKKKDDNNKRKRIQFSEKDEIFSTFSSDNDVSDFAARNDAVVVDDDDEDDDDFEDGLRHESFCSNDSGYSASNFGCANFCPITLTSASSSTSSSSTSSSSSTMQNETALHHPETVEIADFAPKLVDFENSADCDDISFDQLCDQLFNDFNLDRFYQSISVFDSIDADLLQLSDSFSLQTPLPAPPPLPQQQQPHQSQDLQFELFTSEAISNSNFDSNLAIFDYDREQSSILMLDDLVDRPSSLTTTSKSQTETNNNNNNNNNNATNISQHKSTIYGNDDENVLINLSQNFDLIPEHHHHHQNHLTRATIEEASNRQIEIGESDAEIAALLKTSNLLHFDSQSPALPSEYSSGFTITEIDLIRELTLSLQALQNPYKRLRDYSLYQPICSRRLSQYFFFRMIRACKRLRAFASLHAADQAVMLKRRLMELLAIRSVVMYHPDRDAWCFVDDKNRVSVMVGMQLLRPFCDATLYARHRALPRRFREEWKRDSVIIDIVTAIVLFTPQDGYRDCDTIRARYDRYVALLQRYLAMKYESPREADECFRQLMRNVDEMRQINHSIFTFFRNYSHFLRESPLFVELLDLNGVTLDSADDRNRVVV